ncbi:hypothetical protein E5198_07580 [Pseudomonas sp. A-1]|uniref:hypothetical protein n=1 Tax=Pseudomonas sp. A-1 TaxID=1821274 RepID=UPI0010A69F4E|nr:hypothetical protein [Pseudomonas sp. A-1]THG83416.1 hypothetical protein E5198_07580 [Pseudomonas sp. A-1]
MDEFNPYAPPRSPVAVPPAVPPEPAGYALYRWLNLLYGAAMGLSLLVLAGGGRLQALPVHLLVVSIFLAPLLSFALVLGRRRQAFRRWRWFQAAGSGVLLLFCLQDVVGSGVLNRAGLFMTLANLFSLGAGQYFLARRLSPGAAGEAAG